MIKISDLLADGQTTSFEFFPPKTREGERSLGRALDELEGLKPDFVSVTYGAGGSDRDRTRDLVVEITRDRTYPAMAHLTCIGHTEDELKALLSDYDRNGVGNILALAGDPPVDGSDAGGDFRYASDLVDLIHRCGDFSVGVAAFPEGHPRSGSIADDRKHLATKLESADFGITQFFLRSVDYLALMEDLASLGCETPVLPGIIPVINPESVKRFAAMNGAEFPTELADRLDTAAGDETEIHKIAVDWATHQCQGLLDAGVPGLHIYSLNRSTASREIFENIGLA